MASPVVQGELLSRRLRPILVVERRPESESVRQIFGPGASSCILGSGRGQGRVCWGWRTRSWERRQPGVEVITQACLLRDGTSTVKELSADVVLALAQLASKQRSRLYEDQVALPVDR